MLNGPTAKGVDHESGKFVRADRWPGIPNIIRVAKCVIVVEQEENGIDDVGDVAPSSYFSAITVDLNGLALKEVE